ncbi:MAG: UvrD-helicase domain-containing protein [Deltaproteobacteria bacterium]|nr:UvrD-helicase domain-containing protein [Deltaproteobacteria bacterium]MDQ3298085.1 UvrD-helicase domain-containing protein [Myxococcota bacterium]
MNIRIITASAGSGKTYRLTQELDGAIAAGRARPEGIVAVTFTNLAAAELIERARGRLLQHGRALEAHQLLASRIGTVNAVCGSLVTDFAFELGMSPAVRVLDDAAAELEFRRALARVVNQELATELEKYKTIFESDFDWRREVRRIVEAARANGLGMDALAGCATRSNAELDTCLGPCTTADLDALLRAAIDDAVAAIDTTTDETAATREYVKLLRASRLDLGRGRLSWGDWAKLASQGPAKKSKPHVVAVQAIATRHVEHPRLRSEMHRLITSLFGVAAAGLAAYESYKRERGVIDFIDQEALALQLLRRADVRDALAGQIDLFLVDEFQDTSPIQLAVFLELAALATEAIWVGDPKQAIYGFRGTDPALMDAAIESLTSVSTDADLIAQATTAVSRGQLESLGTSYRSRPALVRLTSEMFARAFAVQGMPEDRTRLEPALVVEPAGLGDIIEYWPLDDAKNAELRANAVAAAMRDLLAREPMVRDGTGVRTATRKDLAVLCRTNAQCQAVADALARIGVPAVVPRMALLDTLEIMVATAALRLWIDPDDSVAAAELARLITHPEDLDAIVAHALAAPGRDAFRTDPTVVRILAARALDRDVGPIAAVDAVIAASELRLLCAGWGEAAQRLANLDALRAHAVAYHERACAAGDAASPVGLVAYLEDLAAEGSWSEARTDSQALLAGEDAITVSTWHRAKGLEWPITVLFGLESMREPRSHGVHVFTDRAAFVVADPLGGRWIRYWPHPYTTSNQKGAVREAFEASAIHAALVDRAQREALRVLYVGWTRARDRLVLAAQRNCLLAGIVGTLADIDPMLITEPSAEVSLVESLQWAAVDVDVLVSPSRPSTPLDVAPVPGTVTVGVPIVPRVAAHTSPSTAQPIACSLGEIVELGPRLTITGNPEMEDVGHAVHGFLAADRPGLAEPDRLAMASELLSEYGVAANLAAADIVAAASRFWTWLDARFPGARLHREWPVVHRTDAGTIVAGTADLVLVDIDGFTLVDHKTFPGGLDAADERARGYSGQLAAYVAAIRAASGTPPRSTWIHFPVLGRAVEVRLTADHAALDHRAG